VDDSSAVSYTNRDSQGQNDNWTISSSLTLTSFLRLTTISYSSTKTHQISGGQDGGIRTTETISWGGQLSNVHKLFLINKITNNLSFNHTGSFSSNITPQNESKTLTFGPFIGFNTSIKKIQLTYNYRKTITETSPRTSTGVTLTTNNDGHNMNLTYSFSAQQGMTLNFLFFKNKRIKFNNNMNLSLILDLNNMKTQSKGQDPTQDISTLSIKPQVSYNFSRSLNGGLTGEYTKKNDRRLEKETVTRALRIWIELRF